MKNNEQLKQLICQEIARSGGTISFAKFMELALYAPNLGYYNTATRKFGRGGDFITAAEISPLFAACVAKQCQQILSALSGGDILEIGAGSGVFAKNILIELKKRDALPQHYFIFEISPALRTQQFELLQQECPEFLSRVHWLDKLPDNGITGIIFANEVLDALPVHCFQITETEVEERGVAWENDRFVWRPQKKIAPALMTRIEAILQENPLPYDYASEINLEIPHWITRVAQSLHQGAVLLFDYGYGRREYYHPDRRQGTLMCFSQKHNHSDPLIQVGLQDITAHVDFTAVAESALDAGLRVAGYTTQAAFLLACGLLDLAAESPDTSATATYQQAQVIKTLTLPSQMGEIVKVICLTKQLELSLLGFALHDRRKDL